MKANKQSKSSAVDKLIEMATGVTESDIPKSTAPDNNLDSSQQEAVDAVIRTMQHFSDDQMWWFFENLPLATGGSDRFKTACAEVAQAIAEENQL